MLLFLHDSKWEQYIYKSQKDPGITGFCGNSPKKMQSSIFWKKLSVILIVLDE